MINKITKNKTPLLISILSIALFTSAVAAHDAFSNKRGKGNQMNYVVKSMKQLDLTDDQKAQLKEIFGERGKRRHASFDLQTKNNDVRNLIEQGDVNAASDIAARQARELVNKLAETKLAIESILTPEQLENLKTLQEERQLKRQERAQRRAERNILRAERNLVTDEPAIN